MNIRYTPQFDFSLGIQDATTFLLKQINELNRGRNLRFSDKIGAFSRRPGFERAGNTFATTSTGQGGIIAKYSTGSKRIVATNNTGATATILRVQDIGAGTWSDIAGVPAWPVNSILFFKYYLDEVYVSGFDPATGDPIQPVNIDKDLDVSTTRNLRHAPWPYFFEEYLGLLYAANVTANGERHKDRVYKSSPPLGAMTYMQGAQDNVYADETLVNQVPAMTSPTAPSGVASASSEFNSTYQAYGAFNRDNTRENNSTWFTASGVTTGWLRYDFGSGNSKVVKSYSLKPVASNPSSGDVNHAPKSWTFQGSNDGSAWTTLDTQTNVAVWAPAEERFYGIVNTTAYRYYRINVTANQGGTILGISEMGMYSTLEANRLIEFKSDSVRYIKPGMVVDVYERGTENKKFTVTVNTVDKTENTFTIYPLYDTTATFDNATDRVTFGSALSTTEFPTGTPIRFATTGAMPTGLTSLQTYYVVRVSGDDTKIQLASTREQALISDVINFTSNGSGTFQMEKMYSVNDNDEIWLSGTKGRLNIFWNTDYPDEESAEFFAVKPGTDAAPQVSAIGSSQNRLYIWTPNSGSRYDGNNLIVFNHSVGCISQRSVGNIDDDWLIWMDAKGNIRARNEGQGVQENISKAVRSILALTTQDQRKAVNVGIVDQVAKFYIGTVGGENIRVCYDFDANTWTIESLGYPALIQDTDDTGGVIKPYFFSNNGRLYKDETGDLDDDKDIKFEAGTGKNILDTPQKKKFYGITVFSRNCSGLRLQVSIDGGQFQTVGRIEGETCFMKFSEQGDNKLPRGVAIDWQIKGVGPGDPPAVDGAVIYWVPEEDVPSESRT